MKTKDERFRQYRMGIESSDCVFGCWEGSEYMEYMQEEGFAKISESIEECKRKIKELKGE